MMQTKSVYVRDRVFFSSSSFFFGWYRQRDVISALPAGKSVRLANSSMMLSVRVLCTMYIVHDTGKMGVYPPPYVRERNKQLHWVLNSYIGYIDTESK